MLSLAISKNDCGNNYPALSNRTRQPVETRQFIQEVAPHHHQVPLQDWVLFPDDKVIKCKTPRVRNVRNRTASKSSLRQKKGPEGRFPSSRIACVGTTKASSQSLAAHDSQDRDRSLRLSDQLDIIEKSLDTAAKDVGSNPPKLKPPPRLLTPDLSDVDEDGFWLCCGASASSKSDN